MAISKRRKGPRPPLVRGCLMKQWPLGHASVDELTCFQRRKERPVSQWPPLDAVGIPVCEADQSTELIAAATART